MVSLSTLQASNYHGEVGAGVTQPFIVNCGGEMFVAKIYDQDNQNKHLINEYVCYRLAKFLDLPIPDASFIRIDDSIIESEASLKSRGIKSTLLFGSKMIQQAQTVISPPLLDLAINKEDFPSIVLFDQIIFNQDRSENKGNLIFDYRLKKLFVIDHSHVFKDGLLWDPNTLHQINANEEYLIGEFHGKYYRMLTPSIRGNNPFAKIQNKLTLLKFDGISAIIDGIPVEWGITREEKIALAQFIWHRVQNINKILSKIKDECPQWKGVIPNE